MHDSRSYRDNAVQCLLAAQEAQEACQPYYHKLHLSMAISWLSLARQDEAIRTFRFREPAIRPALRREDRAA